MNTHEELPNTLESLLLRLSQTQYGIHALEKFTALGGVFREDESTWTAVSKERENLIVLGTKVSPPIWRQYLQHPYLPGNQIAVSHNKKPVTQSEGDINLMKILHELGHIIHIRLHNSGNASAREMSQITQQVRKNRLGFSLHGNDNFYQDLDVNTPKNDLLPSAMEDMADLLGISLYDDTFLLAYLVSLSKKQKGFVQIQEDVLQRIYLTVRKIRDSFLNS